MTTVTPDIHLVSAVGSNTILDIVKLLSGGILYGVELLLGVYVVLFCAGIAVLCRREGNMKAKMGLLLGITTMFIVASFYLWSSAAITFAAIQDILIDNVEQPYQLKLIAFSNKFQVLGSVDEVIVPLEFVIGDSIVLWRVWALFSGNRKVVYIPLLLLMGSAVCSLALLGCFAQYDWPVL
ncbi:hypothetical protein L218DRAFT_949963 [Marasmius fiardii PR-910]|nr:hypothetical protein L218DRAFT_949963 [Marasmius fiardii PR-910]